MNLLGDQLKQLIEAIADAYPSEDDLMMMLTYANLEVSIPEASNHKARIFKLVNQWAKPQGKIDILIQAAYDNNPDNPELKIFYEQYHKPSIYQAIEVVTTDNKLIDDSEWNELYLTLRQINNNQLITIVCQKTLKNNNNDLLGNCLSLPDKISLESVQDLLLDKFPKRKDDVPTLLEFVERLSGKLQNNEQQKENYDKLNQWLTKMAEKLNLKLPTYSESSNNQIINDTFCYFLIITVIPKGGKKFKLDLDLLLYQSSKDNYEGVPQFINTEELDLIEIKDKEDITYLKKEIIELIAICRNNNCFQVPYELHIQLLLPDNYLSHAFELEPICLNQQRNHYRSLGCVHSLLVGSYTRFYSISFYNTFYGRWQKYVKPKLDINWNNVSQFFTRFRKLYSSEFR